MIPSLSEGVVDPFNVTVGSPADNMFEYVDAESESVELSLEIKGADGSSCGTCSVSSLPI